MTNETKLYRKNQLGIGTWRIWHEIHSPKEATLYYAHASVLNGAEVHHKDHIRPNMSGRTIDQQVILERNSRISRQRDKGYKDTIEEAKAGLTNQMGFMRPMLAQPLDKVKLTDRDFENACIQKKFDGHRSMITNFDGDIVAYTRQGKPIETIGHVLKELSWLPEGVTLDGELYIHGVALQGISSIVKRVQPDNLKLRFHWYDMHDKSDPLLKYMDRYIRMEQLCGWPQHAHESYEIVETLPVSSMEDAMAYFRRFRAEKYEGAILRLNSKPYQDGVRSSSLIKLKEWTDEEVTVLDCRASKEGWAILKCQRDSGQVFDTSAPGSIPEKAEVLRNFENYRGKRLTIEYASLTADGIPFHASALRWRDDL